MKPFSDSVIVMSTRVGTSSVRCLGYPIVKAFVPDLNVKLVNKSLWWRHRKLCKKASQVLRMLAGFHIRPTESGSRF